MADLEQAELFRNDGDEQAIKRCTGDNRIAIRVAKKGKEYVVAVVVGKQSYEVFASARKSDAISEWVKWR